MNETILHSDIKPQNTLLSAWLVPDVLFHHIFPHVLFSSDLLLGYSFYFVCLCVCFILLPFSLKGNLFWDRHEEVPRLKSEIMAATHNINNTTDSMDF